MTVVKKRTKCNQAKEMLDTRANAFMNGYVFQRSGMGEAHPCYGKFYYEILMGYVVH